MKNHPMSSQQSERGRSLIEIIAILIIMALLMIAALIGFKTLLDYLKKKQTAEQIATVGMRYKADRLGRKAKRGGAVSRKQWYPEGTPCQHDTQNCVTSPDGGQVQLYTFEDTDTFVVVAAEISPQACSEALLQEGYARVRRLKYTTEHAPEGDKFLNNDKLKNNNTGVWTDSDYLSVQDFRKHPEKILDYCCHAETHEKCSFGFLYASGTDDEENCRYFCDDGKCHYCPCNKKRIDGAAADSDGCCDLSHYDIQCNSCGGCKDGQVCNDKDQCVECTEDLDCHQKFCSTGICTYGDRQYCKKGFCKPCQNVGDFCGVASGSGNLLYCDSDLECPDPHCDPCPPSTVCGKCQKIDLGTYHCIDINSKNLPLGASCDTTRQDGAGNSCPDECYGDASECVCSGGNCTCQVPTDPDDGTCKNGPISEGGACVLNSAPDDHDCCGTVMEGTTSIQLTCKNGKCAKPDECAEPDQAKRLFNRPCTSGCPCATELLRCEDGLCRCSIKPTQKNAECLGDCGCGIGLECQKDGVKATADEYGVCECLGYFEIDSPCTGNDEEKDCLCSAAVSASDNRHVLVCYDDTYTSPLKDTILQRNSGAKKFTCQCNPEIEKFSLPAGSRCVVDCDQCGPSADNPLPCIDGKCGCQDDADCYENCDGKTSCDKGTHTCVCDAALGLVEGPDGQCYCKDPVGQPDTFKGFWRIPKDKKDEKPTAYVCCPLDSIPYEVAGEIICRKICDGKGPVTDVALLLDYSHSTTINGYDEKIKFTAQTILNRVRAYDSSIKTGIFREDNSTISGVTCQGSAQLCSSASAAPITIKGFGPSDQTINLNQPTCACNCQGGRTCFNKAIDQVQSKCSTGTTLSILISDGNIPNDSADKMGCGERTYAFTAKETDLGQTKADGRQLAFELLSNEAIVDWIEKTLNAELCVDPAEADEIRKNWVCKA